MDNVEHCRQLVARADRDRYLASLFAPAEQRGGLWALYAFDAEIARVREAAREPMPGEIRLQWWREVLQGERAGEAAAHPVAAALLDMLERYQMAPALMIALIDAHAFDLYDDAMVDFAALDDYAANTAGTIFAGAVTILAGRAAPSGEIARRAGLAYGYAAVLRHLERAGARRFVPDEALGRFGATREDVAAGNATFELRAALAEMRLRARRYLTEADAVLAQAPDAILPALLPAALVRPTLARMEKPDYQPFKFRDVPAWRRQWLIWRAARDKARIFG